MNTPTTIALFSKERIILWLSVLMTTLLSAQENPVECDWTVYTFPNGNKASEGCLINGKPEGRWVNYHSNGIIKSQGDRIDHELSGEWLFFDSAGFKIQSIDYQFGKKQGWEKSYSANEENVIILETQYQENLKSGWSYEYSENGAIQKAIPYSENLMNGLGKEYASDGRIISILEFSKGYLRSIQKVNRRDEQGKKNGIWKVWNKKTILIEEGKWSNGLKNGIFKYYKGSGELDYLEKYEWDQLIEDDAVTAVIDVRETYHPNGKVATSATYSNGQRIGIYREFDLDGSVNAGKLYANDQIIAEGITTLEGQKQGNWKHYYPSGALHFEGSYSNGLKEGEWNYYAETGELIQTGSYREGKFQNRWKWFYLDGSRHRDESYRRGKEDGLFEEWDESGNLILRGEYESGDKTGEWIQDVNDHKEVGSYVEGEKNGQWIHTYPNGTEQFRGEYIFGEPEGKHIYRSSEGYIQRTQNYSNGQKNGKWMFYGPNQTLQQTLEYKEDVLHRIDGQKVKMKTDRLI
jgi:antitoxin component YwqK of YwqJK toxin-antitoxin module